MRDDNCIFCKIIEGKIPSRAIYEDEDFKVILDEIFGEDLEETDDSSFDSEELSEGAERR